MCVTRSEAASTLHRRVTKKCCENTFLTEAQREAPSFLKMQAEGMNEGIKRRMEWR